MNVSTAQGGASQLVGSAQNTATKGGFVDVFLVMSNELSTPKLLICTSDGGRSTTPTNFLPQVFLSIWSSLTTPTLAVNTDYAVSMTSYFVCGDAAEAYPQMILTGDRNIGTATASGQAATSITFGTNNICALAGNGTTEAFPWGWSANDLHQKSGNLGIADGSVQQTTCSGLVTALLNATNSAATANPIYNIP
jgi:hypothetical protein